MSVCVVSTCFNQGRLIGDAVDSVFRQQGDAASMVIVDDGSTDDSAVKLSKFQAQHDPWLRVLRVTNRGFPAALNAGLLAAPKDTRYVVVLPGDDWLADNYLAECQLAIGDADAVITGMRRVGYPGRGELEFPTVQHPSVDQLWAWEQTYGWSVAMFRYSSLVETGGFHPFTAGDCDWDMWVDLASRGFRFAYTDKTHYFYRWDADSMNRHKTKADWDAARAEMRRHHRRVTLPGPEFA